MGELHRLRLGYEPLQGRMPAIRPAVPPMRRSETRLVRFLLHGRKRVSKFICREETEEFLELSVVGPGHRGVAPLACCSWRAR